VLCHVNAAYNLARWLLADANDAEDAVQEATVRAFKNYGSFRGENAKAWYLAIVRNTCMNVLKAKNRRAEMEVDEDHAFERAADRELRPDEACERAFDAASIQRAIEALPATWRETIILREFAQMRYREIAEVATVPIGTVMSRLARARERLLELLVGDGGDIP